MVVCRNISRVVLGASALLGAFCLSSNAAYAQTRFLCLKKVSTASNKNLPNAYLTSSSRCRRGYLGSVVGDARLGAKGLVGAQGPRGIPGAKGDKGDATVPPGIVTDGNLEERFLTPIPNIQYEYTALPSGSVTRSSPTIESYAVKHTIEISGFARLLPDGTWETRIVRTMATPHQSIPQGRNAPIDIPKTTIAVDDTGYVGGLAHLEYRDSDTSWVSAWFVKPQDGHTFPILRAVGLADKLGAGTVCGQSVIDNRNEASAFTKKVCNPNDLAKE